ncbi:tail fiber assembly protein [Enterobacter sp. CFBP8995]|nr:tail fiber assembly protein [Enterobacter sp. CFBP8995]
MKKFSALENAFYDTDINTEIPNDAIDISEDLWRSMLSGQAEGKVITSSKDGEPLLIDRILSDDDKETIKKNAIESNLAIKKSLLDEATLRRDILQDAVDEGIATDEEKADLPIWKKYRVALSRIDANTADLIDWPQIAAKIN